MRLASLLLVIALPVSAQQSHLVVIRGIAGDAGYRERFGQWAGSLVSAAEARLGVPPGNTTYLSERAGDPGADGRATREEVERVLSSLAQSSAADDVVFVVLIGHGSGMGPESRFNLPGPDLTAADFNAILDRFLTQRIVFVNTATASGDFVPVLSAERRTLVTATKTGFERNESVFGGHFVRAYADDVADIDKDNRISVLEAFTYAAREVRREYEEDGRLLTEHAILDDNADGEGSAEPGPDNADGAQARWAFLGGGAAAVTAEGTQDSVLARLYQEKARLERELEALRARKDTMAADAYEDALEAVLVELALKNREIRDREGGTP